ncbi:MAG: DUF1028 domain-containing protein [Stygiobacter sp.]|jgi:uncharacterized Ntn-hydrolase superfamily protein|uniref:DUF1028 domain-containing protein n=1 Tax=Stygiobacter electus TaxID=3032292 RepID=A0AAE3NZM1_9BACT|nr:DUF1028 domain-containing protein [Stygiobacter electus]MDF1612966.1 DUF1028 domain-containing protein [Stygiobacter electus]
MKRLFMFLIILTSLINAQIFKTDSPLAHTYSIVAIDPETGDMGVAVQSHWFSVGTIVSWGEAGVGVIATQSFVNASFGPHGLELLKSGLTAKEVLDKLISEDEGREFRQLAILDAKGNVAAFTGKNCIQPAGHITGKGYSVQANLMMNDKVWPAMSKAFENSKGSFAERILDALDAAQKVGGDIRGKQSAALLIVRAKSTGKVWEDRLIDLRVDDSNEPLKELRRLYKVHQAYQHMNNGDLAVEKNDMNKAMQEYSTAMKMFPENLEMKFWTAVALANKGNLEKALPMFKEIFKKDKNWKTLTPRLIPNGLLTVDENTLKEILK